MERPRSIKGLSDRRYLPRIGKIHGGTKKPDKNGVLRPCETKYFVCPDFVQNALGQTEPTEIEIMFPVNDRETIAPQYYGRFNIAEKLVCCGNGECAINREEPVEKEISCPCHYLTDEKPQCKARMNILFMIPSVSPFGVFQLDTGSVTSIMQLNSSLDFISGLTGGFFAGIPLVLKKEEKHIPDPKTGKMMPHWVVYVEAPRDPERIKMICEKAKQQALSGIIQPMLPSIVELQDEPQDIYDDVESIPMDEAPKQLPALPPTPPPVPEPQTKQRRASVPKSPAQEPKKPESDEEKLRSMIAANLKRRNVDIRKFNDWLLGLGKPTLDKMSLDALNKMADEEIMEKALAKFFADTMNDDPETQQDDESVPFVPEAEEKSANPWE